MKPSEVLARAVEVIETKGWHQGDFDNDEGCVCVWGAINIAMGGCASDAGCVGDGDESALHFLGTVLQGNENKYLSSVVDFNDAPGRTQEEVVAMLLGASLEAMAAGE